MNYYSIEFFKYYLKRLTRQHAEKDHAGMHKTIMHMVQYIKDREQNNKSAYNTKYLTKPKFE